MEYNLQILRLTETSTIPTLGSEQAAGYDLYADNPSNDIIVPPLGKALVKTGITAKFPPNTYGRIAPRSGLAWKHQIDVGAGVIDPDYRGNIGVVLFNFSDTPFIVKHKDRIAQLILTVYTTPPIIEIKTLKETDRGDAGYGSTGVSAGD